MFLVPLLDEPERTIGFLPVCQSMFSGLFSAMYAAVAFKICTNLWLTDKFEDGCYGLIFGRVIVFELGNFKRFYSFLDYFSTMCAAIVLKLCTWLYIYDLQIKFYDGCH
jgi:hypothetical protein